MYSRRTFLIGLFVFTPMVLAPLGLLNGIQHIFYKKRKFVKGGWLLQEGDV